MLAIPIQLEDAENLRKKMTSGSSQKNRAYPAYVRLFLSTIREAFSTLKICNFELNGYKRMTRVFCTLFFLTLGLLSFKSHALSDQPQPVTIGITQIVQHPSLDLIRQGVVDTLVDAGYKEGDNLKILYNNAQGNMATAVQIAKALVSESPDAIVAIATPSAQTVVNAAKTYPNIPIIYGGVTDPVGAKLIESLEKPSVQVTGTIDLPPTKEQIKLIKKLLPNAKTIGVIYNPGEANNTFQIKAIKEAASAEGLIVLEATAAKSADVASATQFLIDTVDALLLPNDNTVISAFDSVIRLANKANLPVFTSDPESIKRGAAGAVANDQYQVGRQTGQLLLRILKGESPITLPSQKVTGAKTYLNKKVLKKLGIEKKE